jgi:hypothetical protein
MGSSVDNTTLLWIVYILAIGVLWAVVAVNIYLALCLIRFSWRKFKGKP